MFLISDGGIIVLVVVFVVLFALLGSCVKIVPQANAYVVERLGAYHKTLGTGIHLLVPIIDRIAKKVSLKENVKTAEKFKLKEKAVL